MRILLFALAAAACMNPIAVRRAKAATSPLVDQIQRAVAAGDLNSARQTLEQYRTSVGITPEYLEAFSWIGRGELAARRFEAALANAHDVREMVLAQLKTRKLDADPSLPIALGASIEVRALALAAEGHRDQAVAFLHEEMARWRDTSVYPRIRKNLNLLTLTGKPAPALDVSHWIGDRRPEPLARHAGHPVLLFFWAHWCGDCKAEVAIVRKIRETYGPQGLAVIAPTQLYGYIAGGEEAAPATETPYIRELFAKYYSRIGPLEVPLSSANFETYGVSTTPTLVVIDGRGIVRLYNPGRISYEKLAAAIGPLIHATVHNGRPHQTE